MATLYYIPNWERDFENGRSRTVERCAFVALPNHFAGKRINRLKRLAHPQELHGAFVEIAQIASQCPFRGILLDDEGPIDALGLADKTGFPEEGFARALTELSAPELDLLRKTEIEKVAGTWILPPELTVWAIHSTMRRTRDDSGERARRRASAQDGAAEARGRATPRSDAATREEGESADVRGSARTRADVRAIGMEGNGRNGKNGTEGREGAGESDAIQHAEAKRLIAELSQSVFERTVREADWYNREKEMWLDDALPIARDDWQALHWLYSLPDDAPELQRTKRVQSFEGFLQNLRREIDKAKTLRRQLRTPDRSLTISTEPGAWTDLRVAAFEKKFPGRAMPSRFSDLGESLMRQLDLVAKELTNE